MFYKIINKQSKVYNELKSLREEELKIEDRNTRKIVKECGSNFSDYLGYTGQQNLFRVTSYIGFKFNDISKINLKAWKLSKEHLGVFIPYKRTKVGRKMSDLLQNGLEHSSYKKVFNILKLPSLRKFQFPYIEVMNNGLILIALGNNHKPNIDDVIEITETEFDKHFNENTKN